MFHLHLNALAISCKTQESLESSGFELRNFKPATLGVAHFVPNIHLSSHFSSSAEFKARFASARIILDEDPTFIGFLEGEFVSAEWNSTEIKTSDTEWEPKSQYFILFRNPQRWRESEIHISVENARGASTLAAYLAEKGFYSVHCRKTAGEFTVFTLQGDHSVVRELFSRLQRDLRALSQGRLLKMKLERSAGYYVSPGFTWLPMQAYAIRDSQEEVRR